MYSWSAHQSLSKIISFSSCEGDRHTERSDSFFGRERGVLDIVHLLPSFHFLSHRNGRKPTATRLLHKCLWNLHISFISHSDTKTRDIIYRKTGEKKISVCSVDIRWRISKWMLRSPDSCYLCWDYLLSLAKQLCVLLNAPRPPINTPHSWRSKIVLVYCLAVIKIQWSSESYTFRNVVWNPIFSFQNSCDCHVVFEVA